MAMGSNNSHVKKINFVFIILHFTNRIQKNKIKHFISLQQQKSYAFSTHFYAFNLFFLIYV